MKIFKSWIIEITQYNVWDRPSKYFLDENKAKADNEKRVAELEQENPSGWFKNGVDTIEVEE